MGTRNDPGLMETDALGLAAYLDLIGHSILRMEWRSRKCFFVFQRSEVLDEQVKIYNNLRATVDPKQYIDHYVNIKRKMLDSPARTNKPHTHRNA